MKDYSKLYAVIFWVSMSVILIWLLLKAFGFIHTPLIIELLPYISAVFGAGAFFQMVFDMKNRLGKVENRCDKMADGLTRLEFKAENINNRMNILDKRVAIIESRV